jgi:hypothetical protein
VGKPLYDRFFGLLDDDGIAHCLAALFDPTINSKLSSEICQKHLGAVLSLLRTVAISGRLRAAIDLLLRDIPHAHRASGVKEFRELTSPFVRWN